MRQRIMKKVAHYEKLAPETSRLVPETTNKNHCYLRPRCKEVVTALHSDRKGLSHQLNC